MCVLLCPGCRYSQFWRPEVQGVSGVGSFKAALHGRHLLPVPLHGLPLCTSVSQRPLIGTLVIWDQPTLTTFSLRNHLIKGLIIKCSHLPRGWVRASTYEF